MGHMEWRKAPYELQWQSGTNSFGIVVPENGVPNKGGRYVLEMKLMVATVRQVQIRPLLN